MNVQRMKAMRDGAVDGIEFGDDTTEIINCADFTAYGKQTRPPFLKSGTQSNHIHILELTHGNDFNWTR